MGSLDVDDGYGGPQEYSFGGGGVPQGALSFTYYHSSSRFQELIT